MRKMPRWLGIRGKFPWGTALSTFIIWILISIPNYSGAHFPNVFNQLRTLHVKAKGWMKISQQWIWNELCCSFSCYRNVFQVFSRLICWSFSGYEYSMNVFVNVQIIHFHVVHLEGERSIIDGTIQTSSWTACHSSDAPFTTLKNSLFIA